MTETKSQTSTGTSTTNENPVVEVTQRDWQFAEWLADQRTRKKNGNLKRVDNSDTDIHLLGALAEIKVAQYFSCEDEIDTRALEGGDDGIDLDIPHPAGGHATVDVKSTRWASGRLIHDFQTAEDQVRRDDKTKPSAFVFVRPMNKDCSENKLEIAGFAGFNELVDPDNLQQKLNGSPGQNYLLEVDELDRVREPEGDISMVNSPFSITASA